jgi:hypothetical protein
MAVTRRSFAKRASLCVAGAFAYVALPAEAAYASSGCKKKYSTPICTTGTTKTCRVQYGPPSCEDSEVTVYSPNLAYEQSCTVVCPYPCNCEPEYVQARGATNNSGSCSCTAVPFMP